MVMRLIYVSLLAPFFLFSAEFTASVDRTQTNLGESFELVLTLKEASARGIPSLQPLRQTFLINSQQQSSNTVIVNGEATTSTSWRFSLVSQGEGQWEIPSISIETSEGTLSTDPIAIEVVKGNPATLESSGLEGLNLTTILSNEKPYKNEPFVCTFRLASQRNVANLQLQKMDLEDAIVEPIGEPKVYDKVEKGMRVDVIDFSFLITPLKAGPLKIPSVTLQGGIPIKRRGYSGFLFDNSFDPMSIMQGFDRLEPFTLRSEEKVLDIRPAAAGMNPWLPARSLKIEEIWDPSQTLQEGEPITRSFKIVAEGVKSSQLPNLNDVQFNGNLFKIYADTPQTSDEVKAGHVKSLRKEQYTLIPQDSGDLTLPEITITWWDVVNEEKRVTRIPARTLHIAPSNYLTKKMTPAVEEAPAPLEAPVAPKESSFLYYVIAGLILLLTGSTACGFILYRRIKSLTVSPKEIKGAEKKQAVPLVKKVPKKEKKEKLPDLNPT
jgi:hypothetical protein